jgi:hypothetical protein
MEKHGKTIYKWMMTGGTVPLFWEPPNLGNLDENLTVEP